MIALKLKHVDLFQPTLGGFNDVPVLPHECRRGGKTYGSSAVALIEIFIDNNLAGRSETPLGVLPMMVLSNFCNLSKIKRENFPKHKEEPGELGGYFIMNGHERLLRLTLMPRRNYPVAVIRPSFKRRGPSYTEYAVALRSVREDEYISTIILHWLNSGEPMLAITIVRQQFFIPFSIIIRAFSNKTELEIFDDIRRGSGESLSLEDYMFRKLHAVVCGKCCPESNDNIAFQEIMLPSTMYINVLRDSIMKMFFASAETVKAIARKKNTAITMNMLNETLNRRGTDVSAAMQNFLATGSLPKTTYYSITSMFSGQAAGLSVVADNINFLRLAAQFRSIHRGATFNDTRTTGVRKLLPEAYGFVCPVHTPDGAPCGLLNHLAEPVSAVCDVRKHKQVEALAVWLVEKHIRPVELSRQLEGPSERHSVLPVLLDGCLVGWCPDSIQARILEDKLRTMKLSEHPLLPYHAEICFVPPTEVASQYPGLFIFTGSARLIRPVYNLVKTHGEVSRDSEIEWIGTFEQPYLDIPVTEEELQDRPKDARCHREISPEMLFSVVASLTPYPDFNQSPRNMYQCQMVKQSMGHGSYSWRYRSDSKMYRLIAAQSPLVRTKTYVKYEIDQYPVGFNAVVAVMSYTGYDMEDAMVINKGSYERGFADACIYKSELVDLSLLKGIGSIRPNKNATSADYFFGFPEDYPPPEGLDQDGLPLIGTILKPFTHAPLYAYTHVETNKVFVAKYEGLELAHVEAVSLTGTLFKATITLRVERRPDIGDKYSSRHGQKGVNSLLVPTADMPWSIHSGITPDIIFNPHGFPTRMTMGMMVEFLAGKSAATYGKRIDATPFQWSENEPPYLEYASDLQKAGFNYSGTEMLMCGSTGKQIEAHIFMGVVYYQRLRHMVADKFQVRSMGRFDPILRQPIKGRKNQGGMRLGEMERDCLLSHGCVLTLHDRFLESNCDRVKVVVCLKCNSILHGETLKKDQTAAMQAMLRGGAFDLSLYRCLYCKTDPIMNTESEVKLSDAVSEGLPTASFQAQSNLRVIEVTAAFRYLAYELGLMNIRTVVDFTSFP
ncbi:DNA-directed RNA polymerase I subunit RPA2 [Cichlidogyrus casuarinus]|uniref:DNA-directed RNA polymerase n=1 Tax=Cichlidogyrus casuarinus TaxID=1844966 RepID=A0ABD2QHU9_9PLAT